MKILLYGSTFITALVEKGIQGHEIIGHIPSENPVFPGQMTSPVVTESIPHDIALSVQYDKRIKLTQNVYNLHTGLLPFYGGCDILFHTIANREKEQGLTFHKITDKLDEGEIISKIVYPVLETDKAVDLYKKICLLTPSFVNLCLTYLSFSSEGIRATKPIMYKRGYFPEGDVLRFDLYNKDYEEIKNYVSS